MQIKVNLPILGAVILVHLIQTVWNDTSNATSNRIVPEQIHLSLGTNETEMLVTWHTLAEIPDKPFVEYGLNETDLDKWVSAEMSFFKLIGLYTYRALLVDLKPSTEYYYRVGSNESAWSPIYSFRSWNDDSDWLPTLAIYGDLGLENAEAVPYLETDVKRKAVDALFHVGDIAYDLNNYKGKQGNDFMNLIQTMTTRVPLLTCPGNHERSDNFSHYDARFSMLGDRNAPNYTAPLNGRINNHFHSMNIGAAHIVLFSTEFYYYAKYYGWEQIANQYRWLEADLARANQNRVERPWIIAMAHRPLYCLKRSECHTETMERKRIRLGIHMRGKKREPRQYGLEELFYKHGVDLAFYGHDHFYLRMMPMFNFTVNRNAFNEANPYENAQAPIHIVTGSAGNWEMHSAFDSKVDKLPWVLSHHQDYGYTRLRFVDKLNLMLEQVSTDLGGQVLDKFVISKSQHQPAWML